MFVFRLALKKITIYKYIVIIVIILGNAFLVLVLFCSVTKENSLTVGKFYNISFQTGTGAHRFYCASVTDASDRVAFGSCQMIRTNRYSTAARREACAMPHIRFPHAEPGTPALHTSSCIVTKLTYIQITYIILFIFFNKCYFYCNLYIL